MSQPTVILDTVENSSADLDFRQTSIQRGAFAFWDPPTSAPAEAPMMLLQVYRRLQSMGYVFGARHPVFRNAVLMRVGIIPLGNSQFRVQLIYETGAVPSFGMSSAFIIEDGTALESLTTTFMPKTREPIYVTSNVAQFRKQWQSITKADSRGRPKEAFDPNQLADIGWDYGPINLLRPVRTVRVTMVTFGEPPRNLRPGEYVGYVNSDQWLGRPPGYWLLTEHAVRFSFYENYHTITASAYTKNTEDWSTFVIMQSSLTGRKAKVSDRDMKQAREAPYDASKYTMYDGFTHVFPYPWVSFRTLFGMG